MKMAKSEIYTPAKDDEYVVACNAWGNFGVWQLGEKSKDRPILILFCNPQGTAAQEIHPERMSPAVFAQWFIRTPRAFPDLTQWPNYAYAVWAALHLNAISLNGRARPSVLVHPTLEGPFQDAGRFAGIANRSNFETYAREAIRRGHTRARHARVRSVVAGNRGCGPLLSDLDLMRQEIRDMVSDPRVKSRLRKKKGFDYAAFESKYLNV